MKRSKSNLDQELLELNRLLISVAGDSKQNLDSALGARRYINNANLINSIVPQGKILDWGCGLGHMTYLLKKRGLETVSYDVDQSGRDFLSRIGQTLILATDPVKLPFADGTFDAVLSSGVLEHVLDSAASLREVNRVLKKGGYFFIFRLPNKYSYIEFISDCLGRGDHPVKYSLSEITKILKRSGYEVISNAYQGCLPYNMKGFPGPVRNLYHRLDRFWTCLDPILSSCPGLKRISTNLELVARKWNPV
jgi:SAM-dependent methyltransferase